MTGHYTQTVTYSIFLIIDLTADVWFGHDKIQMRNACMKKYGKERVGEILILWLKPPEDLYVFSRK